MSGESVTPWRAAPTLLALAMVVTACGGGGDSKNDATSLSTSANKLTSPSVSVLAPNGTGGCPLTTAQISGVIGVPVQGGDAPNAPTTLACSFDFILNGRPVILTGTPLALSTLKRLDKISVKAGAKVIPLAYLGQDAFRYERSDPTTEAGFAYDTATVLDGRRLVYKLAILLPNRDPSVDLSGVVAKLGALIKSLDASSQLRPKATR